MPKKSYSVTLKETVTYHVDIEADDEDDAESGAIELWVQSQDPMNDFAGSGEGVECSRIIEKS